jgi:hypothetical protein
MTENFSISDGKSVIKLDLGVAVEALGMSGRPRSGRSGKPGREVTGRRVLKTPLFRASLLKFPIDFTMFPRFFLGFSILKPTFEDDLVPETRQIQVLAKPSCQSCLIAEGGQFPNCPDLIILSP